MPKTRFSIHTPAHESEIFSVEEGTDGSLYVFIKKALQITSLADGKYADVAEVRVSIHPTPNQSWSTYKVHFRQIDGGYRKIYSRVSQRDGGLGWPFYNMATPDLSDRRYKIKPKTGDEVVNIGNYFPQLGILTYFLVASRPSALYPEINGMVPLTISFENFSLGLYHCFMLSTSLQQGTITIPGTHLQDEVEGGVTQHGAASTVSDDFDAGQLSQYQCSVARHFSREQLKYLQQHLASGGLGLPDDAERLAHTYSMLSIHPD